MADVIHRTTKEQRFSVNTPDYDSGTWILNPDLSGVSGVAWKYWKIVGDTVVEMDQAEKDAVDAAEAQEAAEQWARDNDFVAEDDTERSTTSMTPLARLTLSATDLPTDHECRLVWYCEIKATKGLKAYVAVNADGSDVGNSMTQENDWQHVGGDMDMTLTGDHSFTISYWTQSNKYPASIRRARLHLRRR